jgi:hypothetical protein
MASFTTANTTGRRIVYLEAQAPGKPPVGDPCNGCGICCQYEPCPLGVVLSGRRTGICVASRWDARQRQYRCAALVEPEGLLRERLPGWMQNAARPLARALRRMAPRWIAAGVGCDCDLAVQLAAPAGAQKMGHPDQAASMNKP